MSASCSCSESPTLIFACSGAADVGAIADQAARRLTQKGYGSMFCLAGIGGRVSGIMESTKASTGILAIDGCPLSCAKNCLEQAGFTQFEHLQLSDLGFEKSKSPITDEAVEKVAASGRELLSKETCP